jgi:hypothetical protein
MQRKHAIEHRRRSVHCRAVPAGVREDEHKARYSAVLHLVEHAADLGLDVGEASDALDRDTVAARDKDGIEGAAVPGRDGCFWPNHPEWTDVPLQPREQRQLTCVAERCTAGVGMEPNGKAHGCAISREEDQPGIADAPGLEVADQLS